jgi:hypothetical protein
MSERVLRRDFVLVADANEAAISDARSVSCYRCRRRACRETVALAAEPAMIGAVALSVARSGLSGPVSRSEKFGKSAMPARLRLAFGKAGLPPTLYKQTG